MKLPDRISLPKEFCPPDRLSGLPANTPILLGLSGGADSTLLLFLLAVWCRQTGAPLFVAHVHHGIRGAEADRDEDFCRQAAQELGLPFDSLRADVPALAKERGESVETCARNVRYAYFDRLMKERHIPILATAHNADDNLETVLFHLIRGAGLGGLCGIPFSRPSAEGIVIRPLLRMEKQTVLALCAQYGLSFVCDRTNTDTEYTRNRIRAELLPILRQLNPSVVRRVSQTTESLYEDSLCLITMADWFLEEAAADGRIETEKLCGSPPAVVNRALMMLFTRVSDGCSLEYTHVQAIRKLAEANVPHATLSLPGRMEAVTEDGCLFFRPAGTEEACPPFCVELTEGVNRISQTDSQIIIGNSQNAINVYKNSILLYLDSAKIKGRLTARNRLGGDRIRTGGMTRSVKKLMTQRKIPLFLRSRLPILCDDDGILAVPAVAIRDGAAADGEQEGALRIELRLPPLE